MKRLSPVFAFPLTDEVDCALNKVAGCRRTIARADMNIVRANLQMRIKIFDSIPTRAPSARLSNYVDQVGLALFYHLNPSPDSCRKILGIGNGPGGGKTHARGPFCEIAFLV